MTIALTAAPVNGVLRPEVGAGRRSLVGPDIGYLHTGMGKVVRVQKVSGRHHHRPAGLSGTLQQLGCDGWRRKKLPDIEIPERAQTIRVLMGEQAYRFAYGLPERTRSLTSARCRHFIAFRQREQISVRSVRANGG